MQRGDSLETGGAAADPILEDTAAMRQGMALDPDTEESVVDDAVLVDIADAREDAVQEGVPPEEPWYSGIVERKSERSAEIRISGGTFSGLSVICHTNVTGFERLVSGFRIQVRCVESRDCPGTMIVRQVELGPELAQQVRTRLLEIPMCTWSVGDTADWVSTLQMDPYAIETVQQAIRHDQIDGEQMAVLKIDLLRSVLCQPGRIGADHEPLDVAAAGSCGRGVIASVPQMIVAERRLMQEEQTRQHAGGSEDPRLQLGERLSCHEDSTHEFKDYSNAGLLRMVRDPKGITRYVTAFLNSGQGGSLYFGVTDDGYVRGNRMGREDCDRLRTAIDAALRPVDVGGMIVGRHELEEHRHKLVRFIKVTGKGGVPLQDPTGEPVVWVVEIKIMCANGENGWHSMQDVPPYPAPKWCVQPDPSSETCIYYIKQSGSVSKHRVDTLAEARRISREGYHGGFATDSDDELDGPGPGVPPAEEAAAPPPGKLFGTVKAWRDSRNFGFIEPQSGGDDIFCHRSACVTDVDNPRLLLGQQVMYELSSHNGRACAANVTNTDGSSIS